MKIPNKLKDPKNFSKVEKRLHIVSDHKHRLVSAWQKCKRCQKSFLNKRQKVRDEGFKDMEEYYQWKKIMMTMLQVQAIKDEKKAN